MGADTATVGRVYMSSPLLPPLSEPVSLPLQLNVHFSPRSPPETSVAGDQALARGGACLPAAPCDDAEGAESHDGGADQSDGDGGARGARVACEGVPVATQCGRGEGLDAEARAREQT